MFDSFRYPIPLGGVYRGEQEDPPDLAQEIQGHLERLRQLRERCDAIREQLE